MKIEKLTENKIRVIINSEDLKQNNVDYKSIMEKPIESQKLFLEMLIRAEKEVGFNTDGCKLLVEAFSSSDGSFVFTITKYVEKKSNTTHKQKVVPKKKSVQLNKKSSTSIYKFSTFEEFCDFCVCINSVEKINLKKLAKNISLSIYNNTYYIILSGINTNHTSINNFYSLISDFATLVSHSDTFKNKITEYGKTLIKKNAIETGIKFFVS